jgi:hypothetical protein
MYVFEYFLILRIVSAVVCLRTYWPVASCLWLVTTALVALPFISFSQGTIFAYLIAIISLRGVFVLLLYMCLLREVMFVERNTRFWLFIGVGVVTYIWTFSDYLHNSWQNCTGLYNDAHLLLLKIELIFLLILLARSAVIISLHGPSREA